MPLQSKAQRAYLWANDPAVAKKFEEHTPVGKELPEKKKKRKNALKQWAQGKKRDA